LPKRIILRPLTSEERKVLLQLNQSQTAPRRLAERAKMFLLAHEEQRAVDIADKLDRTPATVYARIKRFDAEGLRWYQEKTYFTERPDPQFVAKGGYSPSLHSTSCSNQGVVYRRDEPHRRQDLYWSPMGAHR